jgi:adenosine kinase
MDGPMLRGLIEGADLLFTNDYEKSLLESKTGLSEADVLAQVNIRVTTLGSRGVEIVGRDIETVRVPVAKERAKADPTGVGDALRARDHGAGDRRNAGVRGPQGHLLDAARGVLRR